MPYATPADMILFFDSRTIGDLVSDDTTRVSEANQATNAKLIGALDAASGQINAACLQGERYTIADIGGLIGDSRAFLEQLTCELTMAVLWRRKPYSEDNQSQVDAIQRADETMKRLRSGEWVWDVADNKAAGRAEVKGISRNEMTRDWALVADRLRGKGKLFPRRRTFQNR